MGTVFNKKISPKIYLSSYKKLYGLIPGKTSDIRAFRHTDEQRQILDKMFPVEPVVQKEQQNTYQMCSMIKFLLNEKINSRIIYLKRINFRAY